MASKVMTDLALRLSAETAELKKGLSEANKNISSFTKQQEKFNNTLSSGFKKIGGAIAGAFAAREVARFAMEAAKLASEVKGVEQAFKRLGNADANLANLKTATRGTVSELELMKAAIKADNFKIPMETLAKGLEFATKRAAQTGESVDYLVNSFVTGLGRKSVLILDNLGISAAALNAEVAKTGDFMKAVANITDRELTKMGDVVLTDAQKLQQLKASAEEAKIQFGEMVLKGMIPMVEAGNRLLQSLTNTEGALRREQSEISLAVQSVTSLAEGTDERKRALDRLKSAYPEYFGNLDSETTKNEDLLKQLDLVNEAYAEKIVAKEYEKELAKLARDRNKVYKDQIGLIDSMKATLSAKANYKDTWLDEQPLEVILQKYREYLDTAEKSNTESGANIKAMRGYADTAANFGGRLEEVAKAENEISEARKQTLALLTGINAQIVEGGGAGEAPGGGGEGSEVVRRLETIRNLQEDITGLQEKTVDLEAGPELAKLNNQIDELKKKIEELQKYGIEIPIPEIKLDDLKLTIDPMELMGDLDEELKAQLSGMDLSLPKIMPEDYDWDALKPDPNKLFDVEALREQLKQGEISVQEYQNRIAEIEQAGLDARIERNNQWASGMIAITEAIGNIFEVQKNKELEAAGDNAQKKEEIEKKFAKKQKAIAISQALINGALAITNMLANVPGSAINPATWAGIALAGATTAAQIAVIASQPLAQGGIAFGETLATIGEYPGARTNPEVVAPLDKLQNLMAESTMGGEVRFVIEGDTLIGILNNKNQKQIYF